MLFQSLLLSAAGLAAAQFPPKPEGVKILKSKVHENVTISFKEPGICETTPNVKSYAGHIHLPAGTLDDANGEGKQDYPINTFFWFFEARHNPEDAPLAIWLNGGPGASSLMGLLQENGPCFITEDSKSTVLNPWSWNNHVNMLYIDQPNQVGFSYDIPTNVTVHMGPYGDASIVPADFSKEPPKLNLTTLAGTISSLNSNNTVSSTEQSAHALWHFAQTFFFEFPTYKPNDDRISLWAESYGGHYGPGVMRFFQQQNEKIDNGTIDVDHAHYLHIDTLGIVNGYIDAIIQEEAGITFPFNNTYGIQAFNQSVHDELMHNFTRSGGCRDQLVKCQKQLGSAAKRNFMAKEENICGVDESCGGSAERMFQFSNNARFDITHPKHDPFPPNTFAGYLAQESVLAALGSPVNHTYSSEVVAMNFDKRLDIIHGGFLEAIGYLLDTGVKVHMMYGDRDFACNWLGGERSSLAVDYSRSEDFSSAGYAPLQTEDGVRGMTRQFGNYSFSRVFQSGHMIPSYEPAAAYNVFMRATYNKDIATGKEAVHDELSTFGPLSTFHIKNKVHEAPKPRCYILQPETCVPEVWEKVKAGKVTVKDYYVVEEADEETEL